MIISEPLVGEVKQRIEAVPRIGGELCPCSSAVAAAAGSSGV
jgi:hypothetical protein